MSYIEELEKLTKRYLDGEITKEEMASLKAQLSKQDDAEHEEKDTADETVKSTYEYLQESDAEIGSLSSEVINLEERLEKLEAEARTSKALSGWALGVAVLAVILAVAVPGPKGDTGPMGMQGMRGVQGEQGPAGRSPVCTDVKVVSSLYDGYYSGITYWTTTVSKCY